MRDSVLTADVPLGPFDGHLVPVFAAKGKAAKLHAHLRCSRLRADGAVASEAPLNAATIARMCSVCAHQGDWDRPDSGVGLFLRALGGYRGLLSQLQEYTEADPDDEVTQEEAEGAAQVLRADPVSEEDETYDQDQDARDDAEQLRDVALSRWRDAADSLHFAESVVAKFPWLTDWARPKAALKEERLQTLRERAGLFVDATGLLEAAAAASLERPELPTEDEAFSAIGDPKEIAGRLRSMWSRWQRAAADAWALPGDHLVTYQAVGGINSRRKGHDEAHRAAARLLASWEEEARRVARMSDPDVTVTLTAHLQEPPDEDPYAQQRERGLLGGLDHWTIGVLIAYLTGADWGRRRLTVRAPRLIADQLLARTAFVRCEPEPPGTPMAADDASPLGPGVFDDTPVHQRRPLTAEHVRLLSTAPGAEDQLYTVFSTDAGTEVVPFKELERRAAGGWRGVLLAGSADLPAALIEPWSEAIGQRPEEPSPVWRERTREPDDPLFGERLGLVAGAERAAWLVSRDRPWLREFNLRLLATARGVPDLRTLDSGYDRAGRSRSLPRAVWQGLLAHGQDLDLEPFEAPDDSTWKRSGSGIPLGVLAQVQVYAVNADPRYQGKGHSPFCSHVRERGVTADDDLLTVADLLGDTKFDWCSKCGGYAIRRLTDTQLAHYRAAHRLHDIAQQLDPDRGGYDPDRLGQLVEQLLELEKWDPDADDHSYGEDSRRWHRIVRELLLRARSAQAGQP
ncbi:hypothetical protein K353_05921 [Kitasatospora sp. SolWspMP-SS2h]|uniref:hypothetical protein n=1 Tax=Kitasatospora sp. SolWspMP-SS2h TaxID=1305729 RepID=UPI000DBA2D48|nr:hypothetical protein [Kitasatospora sp. SolWspMP-SS2h]RAJ32045.1 hypothetical protein K353_05921 [Kitasatospora sp. SolWspMP-SS2h]